MMKLKNQLPYDHTSKKSIIEYAEKLLNKTLRQVCNSEILSHNYGGKGNFGQILEKYYFFYEPNSDSEPDFLEAGLELKTSPFKQLKNKNFVAKERLVLNLINYFDIINQDFETSSFWLKNANLLLIFYLHEPKKRKIDLLIKLVGEWDFVGLELDLEIIRQDWEKIKQKVIDGKAHELSEGDTLYLGACTKGSSSQDTRRQPNSKIPAKKRAFSLKGKYVNHIIAAIAGKRKNGFGRIIPSLDILEASSIEDYVISKFEKHYGKTVMEVYSEFGLNLNVSAKNFYANLIKAVLGISLGNEIEEFDKADIKIRTVRLKENNLPKESISFPTFKYEDIIQEKWVDSDFLNFLSKKFFFVFFKYYGDRLRLEKVKFWNMENSDIEEGKRVWQKTKNLILKGKIVKNIKTQKNGKVFRETYFPNKTENRIAHVRPHARNAADAYPLPIPDKLTGDDEYTKHCFWLNNDYVRDEIFLK